MSQWMMALFATLVGSLVGASEIPDLPPNACYGSCNQEMKTVLNLFESNPHAVAKEARVYSGECHHLSGSYDPDHTHYAVVMIDQLPSGENYFSTIFSFFAESNEYSNWNLKISRKEMSEYWKKNGKIREASNASRVDIAHPQGGAAYIYWMRQNPTNGDLYYITYMGGTYLKAFCHLHPNSEALK